MTDVTSLAITKGKEWSYELKLSSPSASTKIGGVGWGAEFEFINPINPNQVFALSSVANTKSRWVSQDTLLVTMTGADTSLITGSTVLAKFSMIDPHGCKEMVFQTMLPVFATAPNSSYDPCNPCGGQSGLGELKQGDTFSFAAVLPDDFPDTTGATVASQVRDVADSLVDTLRAAITLNADNKRVLTLYALTTKTWPLGELSVDIQFTFSNGETMSTSTAYIQIIRDVTRI